MSSNCNLLNQFNISFNYNETFTWNFCKKNIIYDPSQYVAAYASST